MNFYFVLCRYVVIFLLNLFSINYLQAYQYAILVDKKEHVLNVYQWNEEGKRELITSYAAVTGKAQGNKQTSGDKKTPEGIYFVTGIKTAKELYNMYGDIAKKYGPLAFVLNYPNIYDATKRKTGGGIWIHGVQSNERVLNPFDTEGCVALSNNDIEDLKQYIAFYQTPVVIVDSLQSKDLDLIFRDGDKKNTEFLDRWKTSWEDWDPTEYGKYYSQSFKFGNKNKQKWLAYKQKIAEFTDKNVSIEVKNPKIIEFKDQLVLTFEQKYSSPLKVDEGKKSLYLQKEDESFAILAEEFHPLFNWK